MKKYLLLLILLLFLTSCSLIQTKVAIIVQIDSSCDYNEIIPNEIELLIENTNYYIIGTEVTQSQLEELQNNECVVRTAHPKQIRSILAEIQGDLDLDRDERIEQAQLRRMLEKRDIIDKDQLKEQLENIHPNETWPGGVIAPYQLYVTPDNQAVLDLTDQLTGIQEIYEEAFSWIWISEEQLNGVEELWLYPEEFLTNTPSYPTNPTGLIASDCEDQANALVSLLIADGYDPTTVRVTLGLVDFDGQIGGHAWVEVYENGNWFAVDPTMGPYYDETTNSLIQAEEVPYTYFKYHTYPAEEVWFYYNNEYFLDLTTMGGNAPPSWRISAKSWLEQDLMNYQERPRP
jgi:hypothetical protein